MQPPPTGWQRFSPTLICRDANAMIDWLCTGFGFELKLLVQTDDGTVEHSELTFGDGLLMVSQEAIDAPDRFGVALRSPRALGGVNSQYLMVYVDDVEAHCARARAAGATIAAEPATHDYGDEYWTDRSYGAIDPEGHLWWFTQRLRGA